MKKLLLGAAVSAALFGAEVYAAAAPLPVKDPVSNLPFFASNNAPGLTLAGNTTAVLYLAGSSALNTVIETALLDTTANSVCVSGTVVKYQDAATSGSDQAAYFCKLNTANTAVKNYASANGNVSNLLLYKRSNGGSLYGVTGVIKGSKFEFLNLTTTNTTAVTVNGASATGCGLLSTTTSIVAGKFYRTYNCAYSANTASPAINVNVAPSFGVADVSTNLFTAVSENAPHGTAVFSQTGISVVPGTAQTFGIAVTTSLRNALQEAQFGHGSACIGAETAACMPSLTKGQLAQIFAGYVPTSTGGTQLAAAGAGKIADWTQFKVGSSDLYNYASSKPTHSNLHICGRTIGSGTKAVAGAVLLGNACKTATTAGVVQTETLATAVTPLAENNIIARNYDYRGVSEVGQLDYNPAAQAESVARATVHAMAATGDEVECLDELGSGDQTLLSAGAFAPGTFYGSTPVDAQRWAIGYISLDRAAKDASKNYRIIKIDGFEPTLQNVANGAYPLWAEAIYLYKTANGLVSEMINSFTKPAVIGAVNAKVSSFPWGLSGGMSIPNDTTPNYANTDGTVNTAAPVNPLSYSIYPGTGTSATDDCRNPLVFTNSNEAPSKEAISLVPNPVN